MSISSDQSCWLAEACRILLLVHKLQYTRHVRIRLASCSLASKHMSALQQVLCMYACLYDGVPAPAVVTGP